MILYNRGVTREGYNIQISKKQLMQDEDQEHHGANYLKDYFFYFCTFFRLQTEARYTTALSKWIAPPKETENSSKVYVSDLTCAVQILPVSHENNSQSCCNRSCVPLLITHNIVLECPSLSIMILSIRYFLYCYTTYTDVLGLCLANVSSRSRSSCISYCIHHLQNF